MSPWLRLITWLQRPTCRGGSGRGSGPIVNIFSSLSPPERWSSLNIKNNPSQLRQYKCKQRIFLPIKNVILVAEVWCLSVISVWSNQNIYQRQQRLGWHRPYPFLPLPVYPSWPLAPVSSLGSGGLCYRCHLAVKRNKTIGCVLYLSTFPTPQGYIIQFKSYDNLIKLSLFV